jgi:hypothetical protein
LKQPWAEIGQRLRRNVGTDTQQRICLLLAMPLLA